MATIRLIELATSVAAIEDADALRDDDLIAAIHDAGELRRLADAAGARLAAALSARCTVRETSPAAQRGFVSAEALISSEAALDRPEAASWARVGTACTDRIALSGEVLPAAHPRVAEAVESGGLTLVAADRIVRTLDQAAAHASPEQLDQLEQALVTIAPGLGSRDLRVACHRVLDHVDPDGVEPIEDDLRRRSSLTIHQQDDGLTRIVALLHPEAAGYVLTALDARTAARRSVAFADDASPASDQDPDDRRPLARRRADALAGIARDALRVDPGSVAGSPVTVLVTMTVDQLQGAGGAAAITGIDQPIGAGTARRMAASAGIVPLVLGGESEVLDQGREQRLATPAQRRALAHRDGGCIWGCGAPPGWCEVAHLVAWMLGGPTDLRNLALMCGFHHRLFDHQGWSLEWRGRVPWLIQPAHVDPARTPRRAGPVPRIA